ncbi:DUF1365 domain-containing protein [Vibrio sp. JPW-9-11-11]|uniref:DUF1365 domain-containing protein n=1 Tax=Vibrio sp. JPW-9-11-11 TaxID=1416532 RepID=UPI001593C082|nr:DUF1365 family protein [Vibrio sp. JPW-9-11-11]NVD06370.1 DUF1365 domain-containing protein [Vibrio sp. JPW-9-11-11]
MVEARRSRLLVGSVRHRRFTPVVHALDYGLFMPMIDLDELESLQQQVWGFGHRWWHWARFKREDYLGQGNLKSAILNKAHELGAERLEGRVEAVLHLRYFGLYFSPVNFYYLYDQHDEWRYLLAEVSNTPWNERHYYLLDAHDETTWRHQKAFHVSPFNPIEQEYVWKLKPLKDKLSIHLECHREKKEFDATLKMTKQPFNSKVLLKHLIATPIMAVKVVTGIYWHALKLWLKKAPFYSHPKYQQGAGKGKTKHEAEQ